MASLRNINKLKAAVFFAVALVGQSFAAAHALEHVHEHALESETFSHECRVACQAYLSDELVGLLPGNHLVTPNLAPGESEVFSLPNQGFFAKHCAVKPPATGPPSI